jgi:hypothetical protein
MRARRSTRRGIAFLGIATTAFLLMAGVGTSDTLTVESFTGSDVTNPSAWASGGAGGSVACLTAGSNTSQTPIPGCQNPAIDAAGSGVLRLTPAAFGRTGFAVYNSPVTTAGGLDISFQQSQWGGSDADGIAFFMVEGSTNLTSAGGGGGALGYSSLTNALLGVGLDSYGNFSTSGAAGTGCTDSGPGFVPDRVVIRGPGNGPAGYCFLGSSGAIGNLGAADRASGTHTVRVVFDPDTVAERKVTVYLDGSQVVQVDAPAELIAATSFKFGFSAATGSVTNNHEVWNLTIESVNPVTPEPEPAPTPEPVPVTPNFTG